MEERMNTDGLNEATSDVRRLIERMKERVREQTEVLDNLSFYMEKTEELAETLPAGGAVTDNLAELLTAEAQVLWQRLRDAGFIVAGGYGLAEGVSANQAAYVADRMAERLHIRKKWKLFQQ